MSATSTNQGERTSTQLSRAGDENRAAPQPARGQSGTRQSQAASENHDGQQPAQDSRDGQSAREGASEQTAQAQASDGGRAQGAQPRVPNRSNTPARRGNRADSLAQELDRLFDGRGGQSGGPITGEDFAPWSDGLRNVEELVDIPSLRNNVARARERAREMRLDFTRNQKKPDWAVVRLQVLGPLVQVREEITEELARRDPGDKLVPIDRDPVPGRYSELVRRYYEQLGKDNRQNPRPEGGNTSRN